MAEIKKKNRTHGIVTALLVVGLLFLFVVFLLLLRSNGLSADMVRLDKGWSVTYKGETTPVEKLMDYTYPKNLASFDSLVFEGDFHGETSKHTLLRFRTYHCLVSVYENGHKIYSYGVEQTGAYFVGSGYHYVYLEPGANKHLRIVLTELVDGRKLTVAGVEVLPIEYALSDYSARHIFALMVGIFLVLFGVLAMLISLATHFFSINNFRLLMIGLLSFSLGTWTMCYTKLIQIVSFNFFVNTTLEYFCLYFAPLPFTLMLWDMHRGQIVRWKRNCFIGLIAYEIIFLFTTLTLHLKGIVFYPNTLLSFHVSALLCFGFFIVAGFFYNRRMNHSEKILTRGVVVFAITVVLDVVRFNLDRFISVDSPILEITLIPFGTLIFVLLLVQSYLVYLFFILEDRAEKGALAMMAYKDALTGLYNRAKCQQIFEVLDKGASDYAIVSIDLNGLKIANDNHGHNAGDALIKTFAEVLKEAFSGIGTAIRVGGDEFVAIVRSEHVAEVNAAIAKMAELQKTHGEGLPIPLEAAYGIAYKHELFKDEFVESEENIRIEAENVYHLADERMYAKKAAMKSDLVRK